MGSIMSCISNLMYLSEKIILYATCTGLIWCLVLTITLTLGLGIGLGYNYCYVDLKTKHKLLHGRYIHPGSIENSLREPAFDVTAEADALRTLQELDRITYAPSLPTASIPTKDLEVLRDILSFLNNTREIPNDMDPAVLRDILSFLNNTREISNDMYPAVLRDILSFLNTTRKIRTNDTDPRVSRKYLGTYLNSTAICYQPSLTKSESFNGTGSSVETTVDVATDDEDTEITETNTETDSSLSTTETEIIDETDESTPETNIETDSSSSTADSTTETDMIDETNEPTPEPYIVNEEQPRSNPRSRKVKKLVIPISGLDLISLLSKLKAQNRNYSLQIVTT